MILTVNDINKMRNSAWNIYQRYQATMAGQLNDDIEELESKNLLSKLFAIRFVSIGWLLKELQKEGLIKGVGNFDCKKCGAGLLGNKKLYTI